MALKNAAKNAMLDALGALITHIGLADDEDELDTGGTYARQAVAFGSATGGVLSMTGTETFNIDPGSTINMVILRDSGTIDDHTPDFGFAPVTEEVFGGAGTYQVTALTITLTDPA